MADVTPDPAFVRELTAYDPKLRVRWARHSERWFIERKLDSRHPQLVSEQPAPESASAAQKDLWEAWQQGYVHIVTIRPQDLHWRFVVEHLAKFDSWRMGGMTKIADALDAQDDKTEQGKDRTIDNWAEAATDDAYERLAWASGRRVSFIDAPEAPVEKRDGYVVRDRRVTVGT